MHQLKNLQRVLYAFEEPCKLSFVTFLVYDSCLSTIFLMYRFISFSPCHQAATMTICTLSVYHLLQLRSSELQLKGSIENTRIFL